MSQAVLCFSFVGLLFVELILVCDEINRCTLRVCVCVCCGCCGGGLGFYNGDCIITLC